METREHGDEHGYQRLARGIDFLIVEVAVVGLDPSQLEQARRFSVGSPTEFLGETLLALEALRGEEELLPSSVVVFARALADEIREGFTRVGGA